MFFLLLIVAASAFTNQELHQSWNAFVSKYNKVYAPEEYSYRYNVFVHNMNYIKNFNTLGKSYTLGMNEFGDLTWEEFRATHLSLDADLSAPRHEEPVGVDPEDSKDWREEGMVMTVKDQGQCGSCWAFSAVGALETTYGISQKKTYNFSEQELVDCSRSYGNQGCNGGLMDNAFKYIIDKKGMAKLEDYKYTAKDGKCNTKAKRVPLKITEFKDVTANNNLELKAAVYTTAVSVAIEADQNQFQFYSGGIFEDDCGTDLDHGVTAVGYGISDETDDGKMFWIVKNSWGTSWGEDGYIRMIRVESEDDPGICGIAMMASYLPVEN